MPVSHTEKIASTAAETPKPSENLQRLHKRKMIAIGIAIWNLNRDRATSEPAATLRPRSSNTNVETIRNVSKTEFCPMIKVVPTGGNPASIAKGSQGYTARRFVIHGLR